MKDLLDELFQQHVVLLGPVMLSCVLKHSESLKLEEKGIFVEENLGKLVPFIHFLHKEGITMLGMGVFLSSE